MNKMHLIASVKDGFRRYFDFRGRTSRAAFWDWVLFVFIAAVITSVLDAVFFHSSGINLSLTPRSGMPPFELLLSLGLLIPNLAILVRRLRDANFSPYLVLLLLIPLLGLIILLVLSTRRGPQD